MANVEKTFIMYQESQLIVDCVFENGERKVWTLDNNSPVFYDCVELAETGEYECLIETIKAQYDPQQLAMKVLGSLSDSAELKQMAGQSASVRFTDLETSAICNDHGTITISNHFLSIVAKNSGVDAVRNMVIKLLGNPSHGVVCDLIHEIANHPGPIIADRAGNLLLDKHVSTGGQPQYHKATASCEYDTEGNVFSMPRCFVNDREDCTQGFHASLRSDVEDAFQQGTRHVSTLSGCPNRIAVEVNPADIHAVFGSTVKMSRFKVFRSYR